MPLIVRTGMHADESGAGAFMRAADENGYLNGSQLTAFMGLDHVRVETLFGMDSDGQAELAANLIGADPARMHGAFHSPVGGGYCKFFGTKIRIRDREISGRRVAPGTLRKVGYHKAIWQVRPLSFDPRSMEKLISDCPVCGKALGFVRAAGIGHCERCVVADDWGFVEPQVDLRDFPQPIIEVEDAEALSFVTSLIDPDPEVRASTAIDVHDELLGLDRGELWDFTLALSCVIEQDLERSATTVARPKAGDFGTLYSPERLAAAGRVLLSWPKGFDDMCERARADTHLRGHHGVRAELGQIYALGRNGSIPAEIRALAKRAIDRNMAGSDRVRRVEYRADDSRISTQAAAKRFGVHTKVLIKVAEDPSVTVFRTSSSTSPRLFLTEEIAALVALRDAIDSVTTVALRLGIPASAVREIADAGYLERVSGPVLQMVVGSEYYLRGSVDRLVSQVADKIVARPDGRHLRLIRAMNRLPTGPKPWASLIGAILDGDVLIFRVEGQFTAAFADLAVSDFDVFEEALLGRGAVAEQLDTLTRTEAGSVLGVSVGVVCALVKEGRIAPPTRPGGPLRKEAVLATARMLIFTTEISRRIGTGARWVRTAMRELGIDPTFELEANRGLAFDRHSVELAIRSLGHE